MTEREEGPARVSCRADPGRDRRWTRFIVVYSGGKIARAGGGGMRRLNGRGSETTPYARRRSSMEEAGLTLGGGVSIGVPGSEE